MKTEKKIINEKLKNWKYEIGETEHIPDIFSEKWEKKKLNDLKNP